MTDLYIQNMNTNQVNAAQSAESSAVNNASAPIELVDKKLVEGEGNIDVAKTNNTSNTQTKNKRSVDELYNSIAALCTKYGISLSEAKKMGLMEKIAGVPQEELLNMPNSEIQKHVECLKAALEKLSANGEINLNEVARIANNYNLVTHNGWSIEGYEKAQKRNDESIAERLNRVYGIDDIYSCSEEEIQAALDKYFNTFFQDKIDKGIPKEEVYKLQLQDFSKLLTNTPEEKRQIFIDAAKSLLAANRPQGFESVFRGYTNDELRTEAADSVSVEDIEELTTRADIEGNVPDIAASTQISATAARYRSEEGIAEFHQELKESAQNFFNENADAINTIEEKLAQGEKLTAEELQLLIKKNNLYVAGAAGEMTGTANNVGISCEFKNSVLTTMNADAYELPIYREVMEQVVSYVENHPETMTMPVEEFVKLMDKVTNGNYTTVVNDMQNGTTTALKEPVANTSTSSVETTPNVETPDSERTVSLGFNNAQNIDTTRLQELTTQINTSEEQPVVSETAKEPAGISTSSNSITAAIKAGSDGFKNYIDNNGTKKAVVEVFNNLQYIANQGIIKQALRMYEGFASGIQASTLKRVNNAGLNTLIKHTSDDTLLNMKGETFSNFYATQQIENAVEKVEEKRA